ncbi:T9SS type A sorting domain-containing protein [Chitinophaga silvisoli]|uniref:T9SS C-terminal target domain-containing protein n=1 Tax=Chitinophaga silvisoli TaxID=2291814 RepID=A0A3E1PA39_9BACT|nr:T9SS type A sorting domain-containing protein [Chitinophaga silvisoli]RFM37049.1 T9SS C-terminal target domain-containing protein [Chitinophaga silvisoli]
MRIFNLSFIITVLLYSSTVISQSASNFNKVWVQGGGVSFTTTFNSTGIVNQYLDTLYSPYFADGNSNICDSFGNLLLCSDGYQVYDKNVSVIDGSDTLVPHAIFNRQDGWSPASQSSIFLPMDNGKYYFITPTASDHEINTYWNNPNSGRALFDVMYYNTIDMHANNGAGKVTRRMVPMLQNVTLSKTQMMACKHADGKSWWLLKQASDTNMIYKFLFAQDSMYGPYIQGFPDPHFSKWDQSGQSIFSQDGTKYATTCRGAYKIFVADFDRCTGTLSNPQVYDVPTQKYAPDTTQNDQTQGLAFSPSGRFIYVNGWSNIQQIDLLASNPQSSWVKVADTDTVLNAFEMYSSMYLGPDNRLYISNWNGLGSEMSVINNPDIKGIGCSFCPKCLRFPKFHFTPSVIGGGVDAPPCMPNYRLGPLPGNPCPVGITEVQPEPVVFSIYPNPARSEITIRYSKTGILELADLTGRVVRSILLPQAAGTQYVNLQDLSSGIYIYRYIVPNRSQNVGKLVLVH